MARIPEDAIERLKREVALVDRVRACGVELVQHGANWLGRCPFHDDRTPSLVITPAKNLWHCLGACQTGGSVIDWEMRWHRVSFRHAVARLRGEAGLRGVSELGIPGGEQTGLRVNGGENLTLDPTADDATLLRQILDFYHQTLLQSPEALTYLARRGLDHRGAIEHFRLGFANRTLAYHLPSKAVKAGEQLRGRLQALGVLRPSGHEHFNGSLVVPVLGPLGEVHEVYGRKITEHLRAGTPSHLYLPGPHRGVWNEAALAASDEIIVCEALLDALTFWIAGYRHVTAAYGVNGFTDEHHRVFARYGPKRILIAYDRDEAGEAAAQALAHELQGMHRCYRVQFPRGLDANAYALKVQSPAEHLGELLRRALWLGGPGTTADKPAISSLAAGPVPAASPEPAPSPSPPPLTVVPLTSTEQEVVLTLGTGGSARRYRVRGLGKNLSPDALRVTVVAQHGAASHADTLDLYVARARAAFITQAAAALDIADTVLQQDVGTLLLRLEQQRDQQLAEQLTTPTTVRSPDTPAPAVPVMTPTEQADALALLQDPRLLERIGEDFARMGVVGERINLLVGYLATVSRLLPRPLAVIIQSASAAGKTSLMDAMLRFVPPEHRVHYAAMTGQALYYLGEHDLQHKVLSVVEEEGAERASYALKLLQSEGELSIASTGKDPQTGKLTTHTYRVQGPVQLFLTTTALRLDEELANRALVLTVDESAAQTRAIHQHQRAARTLDGVLARAGRDDLTRLHQHAQRLLAPVAVVNPYAPDLTFTDGRPRTRRDHDKYLTLIDAIALLHQHQREQKTIRRQGGELTYIEVTPADIALADQLAAEVLARSLDELPPQTRRFLTALDEWVTAECARREVERAGLHFLAREIRDALGRGATQTKLHLARLVELEYVLVHRAPRGQGVAYELLYEGQPEPIVGYDAERSWGGRPLVGGQSGPGRPVVSTPISSPSHHLLPTVSESDAPLPTSAPRAPSHVPEDPSHAPRA